MRKFLLLTFVGMLTFFYEPTEVFSQSCVPTNLNNTVIPLSCGNPCTTVSFQVPHLKETDQYIVNSIPYNAYPYDQGTQIPSIYVDDKYSDLIPMTFPFCFYGQTYNNVVIGSNGIATFEAICANASNAYTLSTGGAPQPLPFNSPAAPGGIGTTYYPRTAIMGIYHDIDPSDNPLPTRRIEYNVIGSAPCRKFVMSFFDIRMFSCDNLIATSQIVLHESTGLIEVFVLNKPVCPTWPSGATGGLAILGIQDDTRTKFATPPGKNCTQFAEANTGYRFTPSSGTSKFVSAQLLSMTGTVLATADTTTTTAGLLDISFPNVCPPPGATQYVVRTTFGSCPAGANMVSLDTITISRNNTLPVTTAIVPTTCNTNNGSITVNVATGVGTTPYQFSLNGGTTQTSNVFSNLGAGTYTVFATDATGCDTSYQVTVLASSSLTHTFTSTNASCPGLNNGGITINPTSGVAPYTYSLNGGTAQTSNTFTGLAAGTYNVLYIDALNCNGTFSVTIAPGTSITANSTATATSCAGAANGSITVTPTSGTAPHTYSLNGGAFQTSNIFTGLINATYNIVVRDANGCTVTISRTVTAGTGLAGQIFQTPASCPGVNDGTVTLNPATGTAPYTFSIDGGPFQTSNTFTGIAGGFRTVTFRDANGCQGTRSINVGTGLPSTSTATSTNTTCPGASDGSITIAPATGAVSYTLNPGNITNTTGIFTGLASGTYTATFTGSGGCTGTVTPANIVVAAGPAIVGTATPTATSCASVSDGSITVTAPATAGTSFTLNPGNVTNTTGIFTGLAPQTYTINFVTPSGCTGTITGVTVIEGAPIAGTATGSTTSCATVNDGTITVTTPTTPGTSYTLNPGNITNTTGLFTGLAPNTYNINFVTASGCTGSITGTTVTAGPFLTSSFTQVNPVCANINNGSISITPQAGSIAPYSITLTGPGGPFTQSGNAPITFSNLAPGIYNYTMNTANGCTGTGGPVTLTSNPALMMPVVLTMPLCNGNANGTATFSAFGGVAPYQFSTNAGTSYQTSNTITGLTVGPHTIRIRDGVGCTKDTVIVLTQPNLLTANATNSNSAGCSNNDGTVTTSANGGTIPYAYSISGPTTNTSGASTGIFTGLANGNYTVTVVDANGCSTTANATVILVDNMFLTLDNEDTICVESSLTFDPQTNPETNLFTWTSLDLPASTIANPAVKNATVTPTDTARYALLAQWGTCVRRDTILVNVLAKPIANAGRDTAICDISYAVLTGSASNVSGPVNFAWSPAANIQFPNQAVTRVYPVGNNTTFTYTLTVTDNYGCRFSVTDQVAVRVQPPVPAFAGNDTIAVTNVPHQLFGSGGDDYLWSPAAPLNSPFAQNPLATLQNDTKFILQVTDFAGCIGYDTVFIKVYNGPTYYVPNAFSPNGDGLNDVFRAVPSGIVRTEYFRIFNRYGNLVFDTREYLKGWDGSFLGKKQPLGTYVWMVKGVDRDGKTVEMKGTVMLVQ
jgi:gliding motility-associated-like protein